MIRIPRPLLRVVVCVLIGMTATVASCWAMSLWGQRRLTGQPMTGEMNWPRPVPTDWERPTFAAPSRNWCCRRVSLAHVSSDGWKSCILVEVGWPRLAMGSRICKADGFVPGGLWEDGIIVSMGGSLNEARTLPIRPIWGGFAINTIAFATFLGMIWFGTVRVRRFTRRRRGSCAACGYHVGDLDVCPECGLARV